MIIQVRSLEHYFGARRAVSVPLWDVSAGSEWLLLGPSGSGKSTLIHCLTGLMRPSAGEIHVGEQRLADLSGPELDSMRGDLFGIVFQSPRLSPALTVLQNLELARALSGKALGDQALDTALRAVGVDSLKFSRPRDLTAHEIQRVAIARAIVTDPKILICDEPTSALDDANAEKVIALLRQVCRYQKLTLVIATHDVRVRAHISNCLTLEMPA